MSAVKNKTGITLKRLLLVLLAAVLVYVIRYAWTSFPIVTGYDAKMMCSCVFISGREEASVMAQELGGFPLKLASVKVDRQSRVVTASIAGMAKQKAIYREGLGCTLLNERTEQEINNQQFQLVARPVVNQDTIDWPMGDRLPDSFPTGIDRSLLNLAVQSAFAEPDPAKPVRTRAVVVVYKGQLVAEQYAPGFDRHTPLLSWSMAKSVTSALTGILVKQGKLSLKGPAPVPEWSSAKDGRESITLEQVLQQTTGLDFLEDYTQSSDATDMLFRKADMGGFTALHGLKEKPGSRFYYSSGNSNVLSRIIRQAVGEKAYHAFPAKELFHRIGMYSAILEPDANGTYVGSSYMWANARDWARFGLLFLNQGKWGNEEVLPASWVYASLQPAPAAPQGEYGYQWWLNAGQKGNPSNKRFPDVPNDMFTADGYEGQYVSVIPSRSLVVVRLGQTPGEWFDHSKFLSRIIGAIK